MGKDIIELRKLCDRHRTVPTAYKLEGVEKEGDCAYSRSDVTEIWKGRYRGEFVALKILRVSQDNPEIPRAKSVRIFVRSSSEGWFVLNLTGTTAVLQGSCVDEAGQPLQHTSILWGINDSLRLLPGVSLVQKWKHYGVFEGESTSQSIQFGQCILISYRPASAIAYQPFANSYQMQRVGWTSCMRTA